MLRNFLVKSKHAKNMNIIFQYYLGEILYSCVLKNYDHGPTCSEPRRDPTDHDHMDNRWVSGLKTHWDKTSIPRGPLSRTGICHSCQIGTPEGIRLLSSRGGIEKRGKTWMIKMAESNAGARVMSLLQLCSVFGHHAILPVMWGCSWERVVCLSY